MKRGLRGSVLVGAALALIATSAAAQQFPTKPVRMVVPFPAGGAVDTVARALGAQLAEGWKQPLLVENKPGAGANIGADAVAKSAPDGYTYLMTTHGFSISPSLYKKLPYDPVKDLIPVTQLTQSYTVLVASTGSGFKTVKDVIAAAKAKPGVLNYASSGIGAPLHLTVEMIKSQAGIDITHIPYKGDSEMIPALYSNDVQLAMLPSISAIQPVKDGKLVGLGVTTRTRVKALPDVPTLDEAGLPGFLYVGWIGIFTPSGTPRPIIDQMQRDLAKALQSKDIVDRLPNWGYEPVGNTPEQFAERFKADLAINAKVIADAKVPMQE
jgi:tripartite-type tricarboxylate transporter receptor subunit TctC